MKNKKLITKVENRVERTHNLKSFQELGELSYRETTQTQQERMSYKYSKEQNFLYKRTMYGLNMYTTEEIKAMHWQKRNRVNKVHKRTQTELNLWKQSKLIEFTNKIFGWFSHSSSVDELKEMSKPDPSFRCDLSFKDLGIQKEDVINFLLSKGLLPNNFSTL